MYIAVGNAHGQGRTEIFLPCRGNIEVFGS